jgi:succinate dehydrogenase / fumarate reductase iron-sulfur subunit
MLFVSAKVSHLAHLPQGQPERLSRARRMLDQHDEEGFGSCTNQYECEAACPKEISVRNIALLNRHYGKALLSGKE